MAMHFSCIYRSRLSHSIIHLQPDRPARSIGIYTFDSDPTALHHMPHTITGASTFLQSQNVYCFPTDGNPPADPFFSPTSPGFLQSPILYLRISHRPSSNHQPIERRTLYVAELSLGPTRSCSASGVIGWRLSDGAMVRCRCMWDYITAIPHVTRYLTMGDMGKCGVAQAMLLLSILGTSLCLLFVILDCLDGCVGEACP